MHASEIDHLELVLLILLVLVAALALIAKRLQVAYPIMVVLGGLLLSLLPRVPQVSMDPGIVFLVILPPLVYSAAFHTSWRDFRKNLVPIVMLAFGLVGFTIFGVAGATSALLPGFDWRLGLVVGSVVAATDAIAATATAKRLGLPLRITDLLESESLVNDGSGLVALKFTLAMVVTGVTPSLARGAFTLLYLVFGAVAVGLAVGVVVHNVQKRINEAPVEITVSIVTPYIAYLLAERLQCSGVLATLACGVYLGRRSSDHLSLHARMEASAVWRTIDFILNGVVFLVLGLQLPSILADIRGDSIGQLIALGAFFSLVVILLRLMWVYPGAWITGWLRRHVFRREAAGATESPRELFLIGWAGMRGVLALGAALSLPEKLANGAPFPQRNLIIFLTFCVIFSTLVLQGLSMPVLIRALGLQKETGGHDEEFRARRQMILAALEALQEIRVQAGRKRASAYDHLEAYYRRRLSRVDREPEEVAEVEQDLEEQRSVAQQLRDVERSVALRMRDENQIHDEVLRHLEHELDLLDARFAESE
jgi:monovalent cation/hydrogen antiporter